MINYHKGIIYSKRTGHKLKGWNVKRGKGYVQHQVDNVNRLAHRIIYENYHRKTIPKGYQIHHIDNDPSNNSIYNLEMVNARENNFYKFNPRFKTRKENDMMTGTDANKEVIYISSDDEDKENVGKNVIVID